MMPEYTANYHLIKPRYDEIADIADINKNMDTIDRKLKENNDALTSHKAAAAPHSGHETPAGAQAKVDSHANRTDNPHNVTKSQVGLGNVDNIQQASKTEFNSLQTIVNNHIQLGTQVHGAASDAVPNSIMFRDANGRARVTAPLQSDDIARKAEVDTVQTNLDTHINTSRLHSKTARFVIGTSTAGWTSRDCDYLCDGTNDQEEIIQALNALPATGGEVVILDGTYNITASINIPKDNVSIRGSGNATTLKRMYNSTNTDSGSTAKGLITLNEKSGCKIQGLQIDGNKATYTASYNYGIYLYSSSSDNRVTGNTCNNNSYYGIYLSSSSNNTVTGNTCNNNNNEGITLVGSNNNTITGNTCIRGTGQPSDYTSDQYTIHLSGSGNRYNLISSNNCMGKDVVIEGGTSNTSVNNKYN